MENQTSHHVLQAVAAVGALGRENDTLIKGTARQAATIRTLTERNSHLEAEVNLEKYNVEFVKVQARKTREKMKALKQEAKRQAAIRADQAKQDAKTIAILRGQITTQQQAYFALQQKQQKAAPAASQALPNINVQMTRHPLYGLQYELTFEMTEYKVRWDEYQIRMMRPEALESFAEHAVNNVLHGLKARMVQTILGHFGKRPMTPEEKFQARVKAQSDGLKAMRNPRFVSGHDPF